MIQKKYLMKTSTFYKNITIVFLLIGSFTMHAQNKLSKTIEKSIPINNINEIQLEHKYGDLNITGWEKDSIAFVINIIVIHKKKEESKELLDRIQLTVKTVGDLLHISTKIEEKSSSSFSRYFSKANPLGPNKSNINIEYTLYIPNNKAFSVSNKFGDIFINDWNGKLSANVEHGDVWIGNDLTNATIKMKFGKLKAQSIAFGNITLKNAELDLKSSKNLILNSNGSTITIGQVTSLEMDSSKDKIKILNTGSIRGDLDFTEIQLDTVVDEINLTMKITDIKVSKIKVPEAFVHIDQESSDIDINITGLAFKFKAYLEQGVIRIPRSFQNINTNMIDKGKGLRQINATYGDHPKGKITITGEKGNIVLRENP